MSKTPLVDELILKASHDIGMQEWPGLRETELTEADIKWAERVLKKV